LINIYKSMKVTFFLFITLVAFSSCGYRSLHWKFPVEVSDRKFLDSTQCSMQVMQDSAVVICPSTATEVRTMVSNKSAKLKGVFMFSSDCGGFYESFAKAKGGFDSIPNFEYDVIFNDDFVRIIEAKRIMKVVGISGKFYIADERVYGRFLDERVKFKKMIGELGLTVQDIRRTMQGEIPSEVYDNFKEKYAYLTGTLYYLMDENGKTISLTYNLDPEDVISILKAMKK